MTFQEVEESLTKIAGVLTPQLGVMIAFFLGSNKETQRNILKRDQPIAKFCIGLSFIYHFSFWVLLILTIGLGYFGNTIDDNAIALIKITSLLSIIGISPVAYLFANNTK